VPSILFGWPDDVAEEVLYRLEIPGLTSLILTHSWDGEVQGYEAFAEDERPPMLPVFLSFRVMVAIGMAMVLTGLMAAWLWWRKKLFTTRWFQRWCMMMTPAGFIAVLAGWFVTEIGRQPYVAYGVIRTSDAVSPVLGEQVAFSLIAFIIIYTLVFGAGTYYILCLIGKGPHTQEETYGSHGGDEKKLVKEAAKDLNVEDDKGGNHA
jgi:cytochrome d ubiquinol oxidase subunit I